MKIAIATFDGLPDGYDTDAPALIAALAARGAGAEAVAWDGGADWGSYDLVVVRSTWNYTDAPEAFLDWAAKVPRLANRAEVLAWNIDKRYLRDLEAAGVPVVPTLWDPADLPDWSDYVIKPAISAGARDTARWSTGEAEQARAHLDALLAEGRTVMVQPYLDGIDLAGESALVFIDGAFSHAARKEPILEAGAGISELNGGTLSRREPSPAELEVAGRVLQAAPADLLYARVDLIPGPDGAPVLLELELAEPFLFLHLAPEAAGRLADAILKRVSSY
ncbi:ATP-grasp domain-containing protein [Actinocorallia lasiicapitis]